jgi:hypothetical protein
MNEELEPVKKALVLVFSRWLQKDPSYYEDLKFSQLTEIREGITGMMQAVVDETINEVFTIQPKPQTQTPVQP